MLCPSIGSVEEAWSGQLWNRGDCSQTVDIRHICMCIYIHIYLALQWEWKMFVFIYQVCIGWWLTSPVNKGETRGNTVECSQGVSVSGCKHWNPVTHTHKLTHTHTHKLFKYRPLCSSVFWHLFARWFPVSLQYWVSWMNCLWWIKL